MREVTSSSWWKYGGRPGTDGVAISLDQLPFTSSPGDQLRIDGVDYDVLAVERPDLNGHRGLCVRKINPGPPEGHDHEGHEEHDDG